MKSRVNISILVYFNSSIIRIAKEVMVFVCDESIYFRIPQIMSFMELKVALSQRVGSIFLIVKKLELASTIDLSLKFSTFGKFPQKSIIEYMFKGVFVLDFLGKKSLFS